MHKHGPLECMRSMVCFQWQLYVFKKTFSPCLLQHMQMHTEHFSECLILGSAGEVWKDMMQI